MLNCISYDFCQAYEEDLQVLRWKGEYAWFLLELLEF